jgi:hypothetical protein
LSLYHPDRDHDGWEHRSQNPSHDDCCSLWRNIGCSMKLVSVFNVSTVRTECVQNIESSCNLQRWLLFFLLHCIDKLYREKVEMKEESLITFSEK